jgi:hypothetical protein
MVTDAMATSFTLTVSKKLTDRVNLQPNNCTHDIVG